MKNIITNNSIINIFCTMIKYIVAITSNSISLFSNAMYDAGSILKEGAIYRNNKDEKKKGLQSIYCVLIGIIIIAMGVLTIINIIANKEYKIKWYAALVSLICFLLVNISNSIKYVLEFNKDRGEIIKINRDFKFGLYLPILVVIIYIITLFKKFLPILKYADLVGGIFISLLTIIMGLKYIYNNLHLVDKKNLIDINKKVNSYNFIKYVNKTQILEYGYSKKAVIDIAIDNKVQIIDVYPNLIEMSYDIFKKYSDIEEISIIKTSYSEKKMVINNARNSRSGNGKKGSTKKNTSKKHK